MSVALQENHNRSKQRTVLDLPDNISDDNTEIKVNIKFCELLCAKFCHDMAGPIGAINNGIDFVESETAEMRKTAIELVTASSKQAISNLTFLRQAYGFIPTDAEVSFYAMRTLVKNFLKQTKIKFDIFKHVKAEVINGQIAKLIYNLAITTASLMMFSGDLNITFNLDNIKITSMAPVHKIDKEVELLLTGKSKVTNLTTRNIQTVLTRMLIEKLQYNISINYNSPDLLVITLETP